METATAEKKKKGTAKTEAIIGTGLSKLDATLKALSDATQQFNELPKMLADYTLKIADADERLNGLNIKYEEQKRANKVSLELAMKEDAMTLIMTTLLEEKKVAIDKDEYEALKAKAVYNETALKQAVAEAVGAATGSLKAKYEADVRVKEAEFKAQEAENKAAITTANTQIKSLQDECKKWEKQLDDERKASVDRAKAAQIGNLNITPTQGR